tara:strand:+ start:385 stop:594 length:210 start_codon:yes stop_codon:yes gene_type:complete
MQLTKYQKARLLEFNWEIIEEEIDGNIQNCSWIEINKENKEIYNQIKNLLNLKQDSESIKLLIVATSQK